jgi:hypothetical protein
LSENNTSFGSYLSLSHSATYIAKRQHFPFHYDSRVSILRLPRPALAEREQSVIFLNSIYEIANFRAKIEKNIALLSFIADILQIPSTVSVSVKLPKFKKLRQWSHDSIVNLSQLTARTAPTTSSGGKQRHSSELPTTGITTISSAIHEQQIDPKKDNFGLYALKCDRSKTLANARRGILLNLPSTGKIKSRAVETGSFHSVERNHEIFKSCEAAEDGGDDNLRKLDEMNQQKGKIEPPPRKKKKLVAPHISALHQKTKQHVYRAGQSTTIAMESLEKNDSGLYRIVGAATTANITMVEPRNKEMAPTRAVAVVRPKVEKAVVVKSTPKVKDYEWHKHQRRPSNSFVNKKPTKLVQSTSIDSKKSSETVDIFKANRSADKENMFDEFDELFEKNKTLSERNKRPDEGEDQTPATAFKKLGELKKFSSLHLHHPSGEDGNEDIKEVPLIKVKEVDNKAGNKASDVYDKNLAAARVKYVNSLLKEGEKEETKDYDIVADQARFNEASPKPKIVSEQVKQQHVDVNKRKIMYYNDESEMMQEMIMKRVQTTETSSQEKKMSTMDVKDYDTERAVANLNEHPTSVDYKHPTQLVSTNISSSSNSLRRTIFVFNL